MITDVITGVREVIFMKYKGKTLLLDNFREVLKGYSVDVQDVVRSALLDGVSIEKYLESCKSNPYRLDQIRLGMKEKIDECYFRYTSGEVIRGIRGLLKQGVDLSQLKKYKPGSLSDKCFLYLICWCKDGFNVSNLNLSIIPDYLLEFFDYGVRKGINMKVFNNGFQYSLIFADYCIRIMENDCDASKYAIGEWDNEVLSKMEALSSLHQKKRYNAVYGVIDCSDNLNRISLLEKLYTQGVDLSKVTEKDATGVALYSDEKLELLMRGYNEMVDLMPVLTSGATVDEMRAVLAEKVLEKGRVISGSLRSKDPKRSKK